MNNKIKIVLEYFMLAVGSIIAAFAIEEFLVPNMILDGGVVGISIIINNLTLIPLSILTVLINLPFLVMGARRMGGRFVMKSAFSMVVFSVFLAVFEPWANVTEQTLLAVCFGGLILGIGVGLVIRFGGCLDGTETVAILLNRRFKFPVGRTVLIFNVVIYSAAGFLFGWDRAMYSLLTYFITSKVIDMVENGMDQAKAAMIITDGGNVQSLANKIYKRLGRTVTIMNATGLVSGEKKIVYCVVTTFEVWELKHIIDTIDSSAFVTISDVSEIIGKHIKSVELVHEEDDSDAAGADSDVNAGDNINRTV